MFSSLKCDGNVHVNTLAGLTPFNLTIYTPPTGFLNIYVNIISQKFYLVREWGACLHSSPFPVLPWLSTDRGAICHCAY